MNVAGGTERPEVMVIANTVHRHTHAIEQKSIIGRKLDRADAEWKFVAIDKRAVAPNSRHGNISPGVFQGPPLWFGDLSGESGNTVGRGCQA